VEELGRVVRAQRVDAGHVVEQLAALHAGGERVLVERVAAHHARAALLELGGRVVGAGQRDDLVALLGEAGEQRAADDPAAARQEDARHAAGRSDSDEANALR
jgi:hypothetical protein